MEKCYFRVWTYIHKRPQQRAHCPEWLRLVFDTRAGRARNKSGENKLKEESTFLLSSLLLPSPLLSSPLLSFPVTSHLFQSLIYSSLFFQNQCVGVLHNPAAAEPPRHPPAAGEGAYRCPPLLLRYRRSAKR